MKKLLIIFSIISTLYSCVSIDEVNIKQIPSKYPIVLKKGRNSNMITTVKFPLTFEMSKKTLKKVQFINAGYWYNNKYFNRDSWGSGVTTYYIDEDTLKMNIKVQNINFRKKLFITYTSHRPNYNDGDELFDFFKPYLDKMKKEKKDTLHIESIDILKNKNLKIINNFLLGDSLLFRIENNNKIVPYVVPVQVK